MPAPASTPPPPPATNNTPYIVGIVVLALLAFGLYRWKSSSDVPVAPQVTTVTQTAPKQDDVPILNAPPPPPKAEDVPDAGDDDAGAKTAPKSTGGTASGGPGGCGSACQGSATPALQAALRGTAQSAQGCYNRALRTSEVSGNLTVSVQVGPSGNVCGASLAADNVHSNEITQCVLGRFRGHNFPPPSNGCVTVNIPINFTIKQ